MVRTQAFRASFHIDERIQPPRKKQYADNGREGQSATLKRSKLAKDNGITAEDEAEIKATWVLFRQQGVQGYNDEKEGVVKTQDIQSLMRSATVIGNVSDLC